MLILSVFSFSGSAGAHSGRTDSRGGHNCNVAPCAGTYHYHNSGTPSGNRATDRNEDSTIFKSPWFWIIGVGGIYFILINIYDW